MRLGLFRAPNKKLAISDEGMGLGEISISCNACSHLAMPSAVRLVHISTRPSHMWPRASPEARSKRGRNACGVYLPDLEQPRPPDAPPGLVKLRLVQKE